MFRCLSIKVNQTARGSASEFLSIIVVQSCDSVTKEMPFVGKAMNRITELSRGTNSNDGNSAKRI